MTVGTLTAKQEASMASYVAEARDVYGVEMRDWSTHAYEWLTNFQEETHPGRGHDINATYLDGDHVVYIHLDPYGNGSMGVAELDWVHNSSDEECGCDPCENQREEDNRE
jgi:hypothetical protein